MINKQTDQSLAGSRVRLNAKKGTIDKGTIITISSIGLGNPDYFYTTEYVGITFFGKELDIIPLNIEELHRQISEKEQEILVIQNKLDIMKSLGLEEYDKEIIKIYKAIDIIDCNKSKIEKAKAIAKLIKN